MAKTKSELFALIGTNLPDNTTGEITPEDLQLTAPDEIADEHGEQRLDGATLDDHLGQLEKQMILDALAKTGFNRTAAARLLGVSFRSLRYRMERLGIDEGSAS